MTATTPHTPLRRFENKVAIVTGAASGMGRATAIRLAQEGAQVFGIDVNEAGLAELASTIEETSAKIETAVVDVTDRDQCFGAVATVVSDHGRLDVVANVAGIVRFANAHEQSGDEWNMILAVNLSGPFFLSQAALPHLVETGGNIVNVASNAGLMGQAYTTAYCASKHGLIGMSKSLAMEYMKKNVRINVVAPGGTDTPMNHGIEFPDGADMKLVQPYVGMKGFADSEDIASAIAYVASDEAKSIHGAVLSVDNGVMAG
jgi:meso-butanediol dehydrogenase/(S,S)-butanediol dehydrogenase/diacetyl reductase